MRYHIWTSDNTVRQEASSLKMADAIFNEARPNVLAGVTLTLQDTVGTRVLRTHYKQTPAEVATMKEESIERFLVRWAEKRATLVEFVDRINESMDKDPGYTLRWADPVFEDAAKVRVVIEVRGWREAQTVTWKEIADFLQGKAMDAARSPSQSTSTSANLMSRCMTAAYAEAAHELSSIVNWGND